MIATYADRVMVRSTEIAIALKSEDSPSTDQENSPTILTVPWSKTAMRQPRDIIVPEHAQRIDVLPVRSDTRAKLGTAIARGRHRLSEIETGTAAPDDIAKREDCSKRHVNMTISLALLSPSLIKAAIEGRLPHGVGVARLFDAPDEWSCQHQMLGLAH